MEENTLDAGELVQELKDRVEGKLSAEWAPTPVDRESVKAMMDHPSLGYLHENWEIASTIDQQGLRSARGRPKAMAHALFGRMLMRAMEGYIRRDQELISHMVRLQDALAKRCDFLQDRQELILETVQTDMLYLNSRVKTALERLEENQARRGGS